MKFRLKEFPGFAKLVARLAARLAVCVLLATSAAAQPATAQTFSDAFAGFGSTSKHPIEFQMDMFELDEKNHVAVLRGSVVIQQKATLLKTPSLKVYYDGSFATGGLQRISRMVAESKVVITSGNQTASGNSAVFDMRAQKLTLSGDVILSQGENVISGDRLIIDLKTGKSKVESKKKRIRMMIAPSSFKNAKKKKKN